MERQKRKGQKGWGIKRESGMGKLRTEGKGGKPHRKKSTRGGKEYGATVGFKARGEKLNH